MQQLYGCSGSFPKPSRNKCAEVIAAATGPQQFPESVFSIEKAGRGFGGGGGERQVALFRPIFTHLHIYPYASRPFEVHPHMLTTFFFPGNLENFYHS